MNAPRRLYTGDYGRIRLGQSEARIVYPVLFEAEKAAVLRFVQARDEDRHPEELHDLRDRARRIESFRRKLKALFTEMDWHLPEDYEEE